MYLKKIKAVTGAEGISGKGLQSWIFSETWMF